MCGGLQGMMGQQMDANAESVEQAKGNSRLNVLNPLTIEKTRDAIASARTRPNMEV